MINAEVWPPLYTPFIQLLSLQNFFTSWHLIFNPVPRLCHNQTHPSKDWFVAQKPPKTNTAPACARIVSPPHTGQFYYEIHSGPKKIKKI